MSHETLTKRRILRTLEALAARVFFIAVSSLRAFVPTTDDFRGVEHVKDLLHIMNRCGVVFGRIGADAITRDHGVKPPTDGLARGAVDAGRDIDTGENDGLNVVLPQPPLKGSAEKSVGNKF